MAGLSDIQTVAEGLVKLYNAINDMKVYKDQCRRLYASCTELLDTLRHNDETFYGTIYQDAIDQADFNLQRIAKMVDTWSKMSSVKSLFFLNDIQRGLEESHREIVKCTTHLTMTSQKESLRRIMEIERKVDEINARVDGRLQELLNMFRQLLAEFNRQDAPTPEVLRAPQEEPFDVPSPEILPIPLEQSIRSTDKEGPYIRCKDGAVDAGNLSGLVRQLVQGSGDKEKDIQFQEIFLASYPAFADENAVLFNLLCDEYNAVYSRSHDAEQQTGMRDCVLVVLDQWLQMNPMRSEDLPLLVQMWELAQSIQGPTSHKLKLMELIDKTIKSLINPQSPLVSSPSFYRVRSLAKAPEEFAAAFTDLESKKFNNITASDCTRWLTNVASPNGVSHFISENEKLSYWIQAYILSPPTHTQRSKILKYFFCVAKECRKLRNFSTTHAIIAGITSPSIASLKRTSELNRQTQKKLRGYEDLMSPSNNFGAYRRELNKSEEPCIPLLGVHMNYLAIHGEKPSFMNQEGHRDVINFSLYRRVYDGIRRHVLDYQRGPPKLSISSRHSEICKFIEDGLVSFVVDEQQLKDWAAQLAEKEQADYEAFDVELRATGIL